MRQDTPAKALPRVWAVLFIALLGVILIILALSQIERDQERMSFVEDAAAGTLTITEKGRPVLTYHYGDQLPAGVDPRYARSSYIHPLYSLDGEPLTDDFPADHLHHHGLFWAWPVVEVRGVRTSNWEPADPSLRQHFMRWVRREADKRGTRLVVENVWRLAEKEDVARETVELSIPPTVWGRIIDLKVSLRPLGGPLILRGAPAGNKGYGGLCFRGAPPLRGAEMTTDQGPVTDDSVGRPFLWADLSTKPDFGSGKPWLGLAIFVSPDHPGYPLPWLVRNSYGGVLNPSWPGLEGKTLAPDTTTSLLYRLFIHPFDAKSGRVERVYKAYFAGERLP
mgnify:CR=1 FL=1